MMAANNPEQGYTWTVIEQIGGELCFDGAPLGMETGDPVRKDIRDLYPEHNRAIRDQVTKDGLTFEDLDDTQYFGYLRDKIGRGRKGTNAYGVEVRKNVAGKPHWWNR